MWLSGSTFQLLEERARQRQLSWTPERTSSNAVRPDLGNATEPLYRPCPDCKKLMNRRNYGRRSGVIVDVCSEHGAWFDFGELARILSWIRDGGLAHAQEQELIRTQAEARRPTATNWRGTLEPIEPRTPTLASLLERVLSALLS
jgi:Zn-finger nucleic acid-binding protein